MLSHVQLIFFDFDGVFTDNAVYVDQNGVESVRCSRGDGLGVSLLRRCSVPMYILSTESNPVVSARAQKLGIKAFQSCGNKKDFLIDFFSKSEFSPKNMAYVGNDLNDFEAMLFAGCSVCPADAHPRIVEIADIQLTRAGGHGAVREFCEMLAEAQGKFSLSYSNL